MRKILLAFCLILGLNISSSAQCNNFPYYMNEIVGAANEAYYNTIETLRLIDVSTYEKNEKEFNNQLKNIVKSAILTKDHLDYVEVAIQNARMNAENCYCVNGQKAVEAVEEQYLITKIHANETHLHLRSALKAKDIEEAKKMLNGAKQTCFKTQEYSDKIIEIAKDGRNSCN